MCMYNSCIRPWVGKLSEPCTLQQQVGHACVGGGQSCPPIPVSVSERIQRARRYPGERRSLYILDVLLQGLAINRGEHVASYLDPCRGVVALIQAIQPDIVLPDRSVALVKTKYKF